MTKKKDDLEDDLHDDELDEEEQEDEEGKEEEEKEPDPTDPPEDQEEEDDPEAEAKRREEIKAERRRRRHEKKARDRRERLESQNRISELERQVKEARELAASVGQNQNQSDLQRIKNEQDEAIRVYQDAQKLMEEAVTEQDGAKFSKAKSLSDKAFAKAHELEALKTQKQPVKEEKKETRQEEQQFSARTRRNAESWARRNSWYSSDLRDSDSKIAAVISEELLEEGYSGDEEEMWEELDSRLKERLPHRYKQRSSPRSIVGGGSVARRSSESSEQNLPREFVKELKTYGYWDDPVKKKAMIKNYYANLKESRK